MIVCNKIPVGNLPTGIFTLLVEMYPVIWIFGKSVSSYGLCMVLGFACIGVTTVVRGNRLGICWETVLICGAAAIGLGLLCGNLVYLAVTYPLSGILARLLEGDLVGGFFGAVLGAYAVACPASRLMAAALPGIPFGHAIGRIGCLLAGCCRGMPYSGPLAVIDSRTGQCYFPVQPLEGCDHLRRQLRAGDKPSCFHTE